jgi:hypothetical protein
MSGADNFLGGLAEIADMVVGQAGSIVKMRIGAAAQRAEGEVGLLNAKFLSDLTSLDPATGEFKIKPEEFESAFANHKATLEGYADTTDFAPAKDAIRGVAMQALPELYVRGAQAMNKQQFAMLAADWTKGYEAIAADPTKNSTEMKDAQMASIDLARKQGWADPVKIEELRSQAMQEYKIGNAGEVARGLGSLQDGIDMLYDDESRKAAGLGNLSRIERDSVAKGLQDEQDQRGQSVLKEYSDKFRSTKDQFIDIKLFKQEIEGLDISPAMKEKIIAEGTIHNDDALYTNYLQRINDTSSLDRLDSIKRDLQKENEWAGENWAGDPQEERRSRLLGMLDSKINGITGGAAKDPSYDAARLRQLFEFYKNGVPLNGENITWGKTYTTALSLLNGDKANPEFKAVIDDLDAFIPVGAKTTFDGMKSLIQGSGKDSDFWRQRPEAAAWAMDAFQDFVKNNPTASQDVFAKAATGIKATYLSKEWDYLKGQKVQEKTFASADKQLFEIGAKAQAGKLDAAVNIDPKTGMVEVAPNVAPAFGQLQARETEWAQARYGKTLSSKVTEKGTTVLTDDSGKSYHFDYGNGKEPPKLVDIQGREVPELPKGATPKMPPTPEDPAIGIQKQNQINIAIDDIASISDQTKRAQKIKLYVNSGISIASFEKEGFSIDGSKDPGNNRTKERQSAEVAAKLAATEKDKENADKQRQGAKIISDRAPSIAIMKTDKERLAAIQSIVSDIGTDGALISDLKQRLSALGIDYKTGRIIQ